jgi:hypothetical protein
MNHLASLWLPIVLSTVVVYVISCLVHMLFKWHAGDYAGLPNEDAVRDVLRAGNPAQGKKYVVPYCSDMKEMGTEAMKKKYQEGPNAILVFGPKGVPNMAKPLGLWFLWALAVAVISAFFVARYIPFAPGRALSAAKLAGAITFIAHGFGTIQETIWMYRSWKSSATYLLDAALYGLGTAAVFYFFWR